MNDKMNDKMIEILYDKMNGNYELLGRIMSDIYDGTLQKPEEILQALGELGHKMINIQKDFVFVSLDDDGMIQEQLMSNLDAKSVALDKALSEKNSRGR